MRIGCWLVIRRERVCRQRFSDVMRADASFPDLPGRSVWVCEGAMNGISIGYKDETTYCMLLSIKEGYVLFGCEMVYGSLRDVFRVVERVT